MKRPGGRTERNRQAVAGAVLTLIGEGNLDFELQEVAALSGVHRTTIFRRWPDRGALIAEALADHVSRVSITLTGDWRSDLLHVAYGMRDFLCDPIELAMNRLLLRTDAAAFHEQMMRQWHKTVEEFKNPLEEAKRRGEIASSIDSELVVGGILAVIFYAIMVMHARPDDAMLDRIVGQAIRGCPPASRGG